MTFTLTRLLHLLGKILLGALLLILLAVGASIALLSSEKGSLWLLAQADTRLSQLHYDAASGSVTRGLNIDGLSLQLGDISVDIAQLHSRWRAWELLLGRFTIDRLSVTTLRIQLPPGEPDPPSQSPGPWPVIALPLPVTLADASINGLEILQGDSLQHIAAIRLAGGIGPMGLRITELKIDHDKGQLALAGRVAARLPYPLHLNVQWQAALGQDQRLIGQGALRGSLTGLTLQHQLLTPYSLETRGKLKLDVNPQQMLIDPSQLWLRLDNQWPQTTLPITADAALLSAGQLQLQGSLADYQLQLQTQLNSAAGAEPLASALGQQAQLQLNIAGQQGKLRLQQTALSTAAGDISLAGDIDASGLLAGSGHLSWQLHAELQQLKLEPLLAQWPAVISAQLDSRGQWQGETYQVELALAQLSGKLKETAINGEARLQLSEQRQTVEQLRLVLGDNHLQLSAQRQVAASTHSQTTRSDALSVNWQLTAPTLAQLHPDLTGKISSEGSLKGSLTRPRLSATLSASALGFQAFDVDSLALDAQLNGQQLRSTLQADGINAASLQGAGLTLELAGSQRQHKLHGQLNNGQQQLQLALAGGVQDAKWQGQLQQLHVEAPQTGPWQLRRPAALQLAADQLQLQGFCLYQKPTPSAPELPAAASLCSELQWQNQQLTASAQLAGLQLADYLQNLPPGSALTGALNADFSVQGPLDALQGKASAELADLLLRYQPGEGEPAVEVPAQLSLQGQLRSGGANATLAFEVADFGELGGELQLSSLSADAPLTGRLRGNFSQLQWLGSLLPPLDSLDGQLGAELNIAGTVTTPELLGELRLSQLAMDIPAAGLALQKGQARLQLLPQSAWRMAASVNAKDRQLRLQGEGQLRGVVPNGKLSLDGEQFPLLDIDEARVVVSPAIRVALDPQRISIGGEVRVDDGHYHLKSLPPQAVSVSADERIVSGESDSQLAGRSLDIDVLLRINEQFSLEGFGLSTRLGGNLRLRQQGEGALQGYGSLRLYDGMYKAYGQKLSVDNGVLIFQGPLDNPGLNITAIRETNEATVGIRIGGVAQDIRSELFSDPAMSPTDTIAILITGKAPSQMNQNDANQVMNAATALGISQSAGISNALKDSFGLDTLSLQSGETYTDSALVVGKYLNPKLFVSYVQNLFTPAGAVQLEYSLTKNLGLKAQSGKDQSIDLLYKVEHGD